MTLAALVAWAITASAGLFLFTVWLIEYDRDYQRAAATRLPVPVISTHALLALGGLAVWTVYLVTDLSQLAWVSVLILAAVALLGVTMAARWLGVYRAHANPAAAAGSTAGHAGQRPAVPPERHFPVPVVIGHGVFATITIVLVVLTALGTGGG